MSTGEDGIIYATARYVLERVGIMHVTEPSTKEKPGIDERVDIQLGLGEKPTARALSTTPWQNVPGQDWQQDTIGWHVRVYQHGS